MFRIVLFCLCLSAALARPDYRDKIPNGYNVPSWAGVGHLMPEGGGVRNQFGLDFQAENYTWTAELCNKDSDGDGLKNGEELGDPLCEWQVGQTPARTTAITHPGLPDNPYKPGFCTSVNTYDDSFVVPITASNLAIPVNDSAYECQVIKVDTSTWPLTANESNSYIVKFTPNLDNVANVQHILLQECTAFLNVSLGCPQANTVCDRIAYAWGPTETEFCLPHFVGMPFNPAKYYMLKILYKNPALTTGLVDNSGFNLTLTTNETVQVSAGVLMTGRIESRRLILPGGLSNVTTSGVCPAICSNLILGDNGINVFGSFLFMRSLGRRIWTERSNGTMIEPLGDDLDFSTTNYTFTANAPFDKVVKGDKIFTACEYDTTGATKAALESEVCYSFLMHYPRLPSLACGSFSADRFRDNRETAFCGTAGLWDVAFNTPIPYTCAANFTNHVTYALSVVLPKCRVNGTDVCNDECRTLLKGWLESPCVEFYGIRYLFDFNCTNSTCDEFQALLNHNCYGLCAYNLESEHCLVPAGNVSSYNCISHECVPVYRPAAPVSATPISSPPIPVTAPAGATPVGDTAPSSDITPTAVAPSNSVRFNQRYGAAYYAMMSVVVAIGVAIAGFAVGFFVWKTVNNRELNYNANIPH